MIRARAVSESTEDGGPAVTAGEEQGAEFVDNVPSKSASLGKGVNLVGNQIACGGASVVLGVVATNVCESVCAAHGGMVTRNLLPKK